ncbi:pyridoxal phosphate-dependent decarboxylase family protein [Streptacidiphilus jiangxiensis]|uniref:L-2,4-diaminobutyrate decarboxylase n=1 Tax=Streptacidiphilus jiangxiensis TaxID=235985 RepID=A0A1H7IUT6_STRJI|nr:pyridoxal-dependent decarboxylase [Streptacidiphilus jiangxiensis]SEK66158.1 L-2,4-diaminobutyrate decarboxylase [Streptacidiphilus jiangxiensis]
MHVLNPDTLEPTAKLLHEVVAAGLEHKTSEDVYGTRATPEQLQALLLGDLPDAPSSPEQVWTEITDTVLPYCVNMNSPRFMGFGDTGGDTASLAAGLFAVLAQQNLINQSFCSPSGTFTEIAVLRWLRGLLGYANPPADQVTSVWDAGGVITYGGTGSNTVAMMLAREHAAPGTLAAGVTDPERFGLIVPRGIGHYSVKSAATWIGCGTHVTEVDTRGFRYDLRALAKAVKARRGRTMAVVAYAGDSRTQTVDRLCAVAETVREHDPEVWLHIDACWGLMCALTPRLTHLLDGIELFDSVTVDPHKVLNVPYGVSALLLRDPASLRLVSSYSDLIMQEDFAFGQVTPFIGTKEWTSLRAWAAMRALGRQGLAQVMDERLDRARRFADLVDARPGLIRLNEPDMCAVAFLVLPAGHDPARPDVDRINTLNRALHARLMAEGRWHLHQFTIPDDLGRVRQGAVLAPLRFVSINPRITDEHMRQVLDYVTALSQEVQP